MGGNPSSQDVGGTKGDQMPFFSFHGSNQGEERSENDPAPDRWWRSQEPDDLYDP